MQIIKLTKDNYKDIIAAAKKVLLDSGLVIFPTETCYGVAALATDQKAVDKVLKYKRRIEGKAVSVAVTDRSMAEKYVDLNAEAKKIYQTFLPGPVTVISKDKNLLADGLSAEQGTQGIRIPDYPLALDLVAAVGAPITATSANSAGKKTPYKIADILNNLTDKQKALIDLIIDAGELEHNPPSTIIDTTRSSLQVLRQGRIGIGRHKQTLTINSPEEMQNQGAALIEKYKNILWEQCLLVLFNAELGGGKTQFTKGIARQLGIKEIVKSPTYTLIEEYDFQYNEVNGQLIHFDAWRLENLEELKDLQLESYLKPGNILVVEWAGGTTGYFAGLLKKHPLQLVEIAIEYLSLTKRKLTIHD